MKFLFFDLDDTLLDFHKTEAWAIRQALRRSGVEPTDAIVARYSEINQRQWELLEEKKAEWEAFRQGVGDVLSGGANALA